MIEKLTLTNFKAFRTVSVPLRPLTVLVGPNGVGKSTVLKALEIVSRLGGVERFGGEVFAPFSRVLTGDDGAEQVLRKPDASGFGVDIKLVGGQRFGFQAAVEAGALKSVSASLIPGEDEPVLLTLPDDSPVANPRRFFQDPFFGRLASTRFLRLDPRMVGAAALVPAGTPRLADDGTGLAVVLEDMLSMRDDTLDRVEQGLRAVVPGFRKVHFQKVSLSWQETEILMVNDRPLDRVVPKQGPGRALELEFDGVGRVPASQVSEGTLLALALLTILHSPGRPRLLLLDDIDRALHPRAQVIVVRLLKEVLASNSDLQIVCTAHSPMIVAGCRADEVVRLEFGEDGDPVLAPAGGSPPWMTPSEIMDGYFGIDKLGVSDLVQRYALLAGDAVRTDDEEREVQQLRQKLREQGADPGWKPVPRARRARG